MSTLSRTTPAGVTASTALAALLWFATVLYVVTFDQGALGTLLTDRLSESGGVLHEFFHDARHLLGVPCH